MVTKIFQIYIKYSQWTQNIATIYNLRPSKIYSNCHFWFENKPSGDPEQQQELSGGLRHKASFTVLLRGFGKI
jgi:hypothetical protein